MTMSRGITILQELPSDIPNLSKQLFKMKRLKKLEPRLLISCLKLRDVSSSKILS